MHWVNYSQFQYDIERFAAKLPNNLSLIVGVPRSGLLAALHLGMHMHVPVIDLDGFTQKRAFQLGERVKRLLVATIYEPNNSVLVLDDTVNTGASMAAAKDATHHMENIIYGSIYVRPTTENIVDVFQHVIPMPRAFEWNLWSKPELYNTMVDIDGILCPDPPMIDNDGEDYQDYILNAPVLYRPQVSIGCVISCRLNRWRDLTTEWLTASGVDYDMLTLYPADTAAERRRRRDHGSWKGKHYKESPFQLFIESSAVQARQIAHIAQKPVICMEDKQLYT